MPTLARRLVAQGSLVEVHSPELRARLTNLAAVAGDHAPTELPPVLSGTELQLQLDGIFDSVPPSQPNAPPPLTVVIKVGAQLPESPPGGEEDQSSTKLQQPSGSAAFQRDLVNMLKLQASGSATFQRDLVNQVQEELASCSFHVLPCAVDAIDDESLGQRMRVSCSVPLLDINQRLPAGGVLAISVMETATGRTSSALPFAFRTRSIDESSLLISERNDSSADQDGEAADEWQYARRRQVYGHPSITATSCALRERNEQSRLQLELQAYDEKGCARTDGKLPFSYTLHVATRGNVCSSAEVEAETLIQGPVDLPGQDDGKYHLLVECPPLEGDCAMYTLVLRLDGVRILDLPITLFPLCMQIEEHPNVLRTQRPRDGKELQRLNGAIRRNLTSSITLTKLASKKPVGGSTDRDLPAVTAASLRLLVLKLGTAQVTESHMRNRLQRQATAIDFMDKDDDDRKTADADSEEGSKASAVKVQFSFNGEVVGSASAQAAYKDVDIDLVEGALVFKAPKGMARDAAAALPVLGRLRKVADVANDLAASSLEGRIKWSPDWQVASLFGVQTPGDSFEVRVKEQPAITFRVTPTTFKFVPELGLRVRTLSPPLLVGTLTKVGEDGLCELVVDGPADVPQVRCKIDTQPDAVSLVGTTEFLAGEPVIIWLGSQLIDATVVQDMPQPGCHRLQRRADPTVADVKAAAPDPETVEGTGEKGVKWQVDERHGDERSDKSEVFELVLNEFNHCTARTAHHDTHLDAQAYLEAVRELCAQIIELHGSWMNVANAQQIPIEDALSMGLRTMPVDQGTGLAMLGFDELSVRGLDDLVSNLSDESNIGSPPRLPPLLLAADNGTGKSIFLQKLAYRLAHHASSASPLLPLLLPATAVASALQEVYEEQGDIRHLSVEGIFRELVPEALKQLRRSGSAMPKMLAGGRASFEDTLIAAFRMRRVALLIDDLHGASQYSDVVSLFLRSMQGCGLFTLAASRHETIDRSLLHRFTLVTLADLSLDEQRSIVHACLRPHGLDAQQTETGKADASTLPDFFEHVFSQTFLRNGHDEKYVELFRDKEQRKTIENAHLRDEFKKADGSYDENQCQQYCSRQSTRIIQSVKPDKVQSEYLTGLEALLTKRGYEVLTAVNKLYLSNRKLGGHEIASRLVDPMVFTPTLTPDESKLLTRVLEKLVDLLRQADQEVMLAGPSKGPTTRFEGPPSALWRTICSRTDELYRTCEKLLPVAEACLQVLVDELSEACGDNAIVCKGLAPLKDPVRIHQKAVLEYGSRFANQLPEACVIDVLRTRLIARDADAILRVLKYISELHETQMEVTITSGSHAGMKVVVVLSCLRLKNKFSYLSLDPAHFRNLLFNLRLEVIEPAKMKGSTFMEVQVHHEKILQFNEESGAHGTYEFFRAALCATLRSQALMIHIP